MHVVRDKSSRAEVRGGAGRVGCLHSLTWRPFIHSFFHSFTKYRTDFFSGEAPRLCSLVAWVRILMLLQP